MNPNGSQWILIDLNASKMIPMDPMDQMDANASKWIFKKWIQMNPNGSKLMQIDPDGSQGI